MIAREFLHDGEWPDPVELERQLRAKSANVRLVRAVSSMPRDLGWRGYSPSEVVLTLFGLALAPSASRLLGQYVAVLRLALQRFDDPALPRILSSHDIQCSLGLDDRAMSVLSALIVAPGNPFLAGGNWSGADFEFAVDERVVDFEEVRTPDEFFAVLAAQRLAAPTPAHVPGPASEVPGVPETRVREHASLRHTPHIPVSVWAALAVIGAAANVIGVFAAPLPLSLGVLAGSVTAGVLRKQLFYPAPSWRAITAVVAVAGFVTLLSALVQAARDGTRDGTRIDSEFAAVLQQARKAGQRPAVVLTADLHGDGSTSRIVVLRDDRQQTRPAGDIPTDAHGRFVVPQSDEVQVYDVARGHLRLAFRFLPQSAGQIRQLPEGDYPGFRFIPTRPADINGDGRIELVGAFERVTLASGPLPVPVVLSWDSGAGRYRLSPLIQRAPRLAIGRPGHPGDVAGFTKPTVIRDRFTDSAMRGFASDGFTVFRDKPEAVVAVGYRDPSAQADPPERDEFKVALLNLETGSLETLDCTADGGRAHSFVVLRSSQTLDQALTRDVPTRLDAPCVL